MSTQNIMKYLQKELLQETVSLDISLMEPNAGEKILPLYFWVPDLGQEVMQLFNKTQYQS